MVTSETDIKHWLLSVRRKLDIIHNMNITSKVNHKKNHWKTWHLFTNLKY